MTLNPNSNIFTEFNQHLMTDPTPSVYFNSVSKDIFFKDFPLNLLNKLKKTPQSPIYHPEGNAWNHTMLVIDEAARLKQKTSNPQVFMWAALLHDIGKPETTKNNKGKITSYNHDIVGEKLAIEFLSQLTEDEQLITQVSALVLFHMHILFVVKSLPFANISAMKESVDVNDVALLGYCDRIGRLNPDVKLEEENIKKFLKICNLYKKIAPIDI